MSSLSRRFLQALGVTGALALGFVLYLVWLLFPRTRYAESFSLAGFEAIQPGDTEEVLLQRLGPPLERFSEESVEQWCFENQTLEHEHPLGSRLGWSSADECLFIEKGSVVSVRVNGNSPLRSLLGKTVAEAERQLGQPKYILPPGKRSVLRYSQQWDDSASYEAHEVILDGERLVRATDSYVYVD